METKTTIGLNEPEIAEAEAKNDEQNPEKKKPDQSARGWPKGPGNSE